MKVVLVVDDEEALLEVFASVVTELGHTVLCAHAGDEALAKCATMAATKSICDLPKVKPNG